MSRVRRKAVRLSENENQPAVQKLISYGGTFPSVPGLSRSLISLAPSAMRVVLGFSRRTSFTTTAGSTATQVFAGNGLFDPDITGAGAQPLGYDQWSAFYARYRCLASAIEVNLTTPSISTNNQGIMNVVVVPSTSASVFSDLESASASPYAKLRTVNGLSGGAGPFRPIASSMETDVIMGVPKAAVMSDDTIEAAVSSNPANPWYWHILAANTDGASGVTAYLDVKIYYLVDFFDRSLLSQSVAAPELLAKKKTSSVVRI